MLEFISGVIYPAFILKVPKPHGTGRKISSKKSASSGESEVREV
jgi:hypothetical protein